MITELTVEKPQSQPCGMDCQSVLQPSKVAGPSHNTRCGSGLRVLGICPPWRRPPCQRAGRGHPAATAAAAPTGRRDGASRRRPAADKNNLPDVPWLDNDAPFGERVGTLQALFKGPKGFLRQTHTAFVGALQ